MKDSHASSSLVLRLLLALQGLAPGEIVGTLPRRPAKKQERSLGRLIARRRSLIADGSVAPQDSYRLAPSSHAHPHRADLGRRWAERAALGTGAGSRGQNPLFYL